MSLLENILCRLLPYRDITKVVDGKKELYLRRFFLRRSKKGSDTGDEGGIFLHVIHREDDDRDGHDHPWDFTSLILKGGYVDERWRWFERPSRYGIPGGFRAIGLEWVKPLAWVHRKAEHTHRVREIDPGNPTWTLVFTGPRRREWGFLTESGWVHWKTYLGFETPNPL